MDFDPWCFVCFCVQGSMVVVIVIMTFIIVMTEGDVNYNISSSFELN